MAPNKHYPHIFILPEDRANEQIAYGFLLDDCVVDSRVHVLPAAGGWRHVVKSFASDHADDMERYSSRRMILVVDFDRKEDRRTEITKGIPISLRERVFLLGSLVDPERLKSALGFSYETMGLAMAKDCREATDIVWGHNLLVHNAIELQRLRKSVKSFLFSTA